MSHSEWLQRDYVVRETRIHAHYFRHHPAIEDNGVLTQFTSRSPRCLNRGDIDLPHRHHCLESTLGLTATSAKRIG